jgi:hypothetical protein
MPHRFGDLAAISCLRLCHMCLLFGCLGKSERLLRADIAEAQIAAVGQA